MEKNFCSSCGEKIHLQDSFCPNCGIKLEEVQNSREKESFSKESDKGNFYFLKIIFTHPRLAAHNITKLGNGRSLLSLSIVLFLINEIVSVRVEMLAPYGNFNGYWVVGVGILVGVISILFYALLGKLIGKLSGGKISYQNSLKLILGTMASFSILSIVVMLMTIFIFKSYGIYLLLIFLLAIWEGLTLVTMGSEIAKVSFWKGLFISIAVLIILMILIILFCIGTLYVLYRVNG